MRALRVLLAALIGFIALQATVFQSGLYTGIVHPESSTGYFEMYFRNERERKLEGPQILGIGDSRMALTARVANRMTAETGFTFGSAAVPGLTPRGWYYMLRDLDPGRNRYQAIVFGMANYDDKGEQEDYSIRVLDIRLLAGRLRLTDLWTFPRSFGAWPERWEAARGILFKGSIWNADFQDFLKNPGLRLRAVADSRQGSFVWNYEYLSPETTMVGVAVDWTARTITTPPDRSPAQKKTYEQWLLRPFPPGDQMREYNRLWFGKIRELYRGSRTRLVFFRLPRAPFIRPDYPPTNPDSALRKLAGGDPQLVLLDEHLLDEFERPEFFLDQMHLNRAGLEQLTRRVVPEIVHTVGQASRPVQPTN